MSETVGNVRNIFVYPVKSMRGMSVEKTLVSENGLFGDRAYALMDMLTGRIINAKNPKKWPNILEYEAVYVSYPSAFPEKLPSVQITSPSGDVQIVDNITSEMLPVLGMPDNAQLTSNKPKDKLFDEYIPDMPELPNRNSISRYPLRDETFFDLGIVHILSIQAIQYLTDKYPNSEFSLARFRPNLLIDTNETGIFPETNFVGRTIKIGDAVLKVTRECPRCIMTTRSQDNLSDDLEILRSINKDNKGNLGVYADVIKSGLLSINSTVSYIE